MTATVSRPAGNTVGRGPLCSTSGNHCLAYNSTRALLPLRLSWDPEGGTEIPFLHWLLCFIFVLGMWVQASFSEILSAYPAWWDPRPTPHPSLLNQ